MKSRKNCSTANCSTCSKGICVGKNYGGKKLYTCPGYPKKHKAIRAYGCAQFRCNAYGESILCKYCSRGE